ncbi:MAG: glycosyltransferase family 4 protein [Phycisphaerae bacterium]|nr:glycosyltransferase family 4 protein [Phycisphaerae bacterium]
MTTVLHLIDESTQEDALTTLAQLLSRMALPDTTHVVGAFGAVSVPESIARHARAVRLGDRMGWPFWRAMPLRRVIDSLGLSLVHAWSAVAAGCAQLAAGETCPVLATVCEPPMPRRWGRWVAAAERFRSLRPPTMVFPSQQFRRRALAAGIAMESCGVIQPAVDFAAINEARRSTTRASLGIRTDGPILLTVMPPTGSGGQYYAVWAAAVLQQLWPDIRVVAPGLSAEARRLVRFAMSFQMPELVIATGRRVAFERLLAVADVLVVPALDDAPVGGLAWAMAASVPIVGSAIPAVAEYLADGHNALLCKPGDPMLLAQRIRTALRDREMVASLCETARGEAFDSFSLTRLAKEYRSVYANLLAGRSAFSGLDDVAIAASGASVSA